MAAEGGAEGQLNTWVSDRLMALLGYSQGIVVRLVLRLARECASAGDLAARLVDLGGFPSSPDTDAFAADVFGRLPPRRGQGAGAGDSEYRRQVRDAAALARRQGEFKLLDDGDDRMTRRRRVASTRRPVPAAAGSVSGRRAWPIPAGTMRRPPHCPIRDGTSGGGARSRTRTPTSLMRRRR